MDAVTPKTPCGRIPFAPLRAPRHEALAHATIQGKTGRAAGLAAGFKDGPGLKGNIARLRQRPEIVERIAELAERSADLAEIYDGWVLSDVKMFAKANMADFFKRDANGKLDLLGGLPVLDFSGADQEQMRVVQKLKHTKYGVELEIRDPVSALDKLMRHRGLMKDKLEATGANGAPLIPATEVTDEQRVKALMVLLAKGQVQTGRQE